MKLRIIIDDARDAAFNMAADRMLLDRVPRERSVVVRFYSWAPPAVSLGCIQKSEPLLDRGALSRHGVDVTVRPTGGRAVLHWNDVTYACVFPLNAPDMGGSIHESYAVIGACLKRGLAHAGIRCETHDSGAEYAATRRDNKLPCFLAPNRNEIMVRGRKLVGSAQKRTGAAVLQHGSIPLDGSFRRLPEFMAIPPEERSRQRTLLEEKCACIRELDPALDEKKLTSCLVKGFTETLPFASFQLPWDDEELEAIRTLVPRIPMNSITLCRPLENDAECINSLIIEVFMQCVAPDYSREGVDFFLGISKTEEVLAKLKESSPIYIAKTDDELLGVLWTRDNNHISRFFVKTGHQGKGIGRMLFLRLVSELRENHNEIKEITVNSSPFALRAYEKLGFEKTDEERTGNGMKYIPMVYRFGIGAP